MTTTDNMNSIYSFLKSKGLNNGAISGIMGNLTVEDPNLNPSTTNSIGATGIAQWLGSRKTSLLSQPNPYSLTTQENFLWNEISSGKQGVNVQTLNSMNASQAAAYISNNFERPGNDGSLGKRVSNANQIYNQIQNGKITSSVGSGSSGSSSTGDISGLTNMSYNPISSIGTIVTKSLGILVGSGIVFLGIWIATNPLSDLSSAIYSLGKKG